MSYIEQHMVDSLAEHELSLATKTDQVTCYVMRKPGTGHYRVDLLFAAGRIVVTGDIGLGANQHGVVSSPGYNLAWFRGTLSEGYLCEKFLAKVWQWEAAAERIQDWIENTVDNDITSTDRRRLRELLAPEFYWEHDTPTSHELYEWLYAIGQGYVEDGVPGMDYPRADAGWLCAIQQRFAALILRKEPDEEKP